MQTVIVIFGASGDLTVRKLIPALYNNFRKGRLPEETRILGFARAPMTDESFRAKMQDGLKTFAPGEYNEEHWRDFAGILGYHQGEFEKLDAYKALAQRICLTSAPVKCLYYLATAPAYYPVVIRNLTGSDMITEKNKEECRRIIIEKPFGRDLQSALALNQELHSILSERQVFRIDHYLGKETVQNVLMLRFGNAIFEPLWNRNHIDHVQITVAETVGVEHRAGYYETAGVLRDMFQNHLLQLLTLVAMEPPAIVDADSLRNEKVKVLSALRDVAPEYSDRFTVRGQYAGYASEEGVNPISKTETFASMQLYIDNWRWQGVPFYLRSGKMLHEKTSEIVIQFRRPPTQIFDVQAGVSELFTNRLALRIQPNEGMHLRFLAKVPDQGMRTRPVDMDFRYRDSFGNGAIPEAYERLLLDALQGDASLFTRSDEIELAWRFIDGVRVGWEGDHAPPLLSYEPGTWGPSASSRLLGREGRWWVHDETELNVERVPEVK